MSGLSVVGIILAKQTLGPLLITKHLRISNKRKDQIQGWFFWQQKVQKIILKDKITNEKTTLEVGGIFVAIGHDRPAVFCHRALVLILDGLGHLLGGLQRGANGTLGFGHRANFTNAPGACKPGRCKAHHWPRNNRISAKKKCQNSPTFATSVEFQKTSKKRPNGWNLLN